MKILNQEIAGKKGIAILVTAYLAFLLVSVGVFASVGGHEGHEVHADEMASTTFVADEGHVAEAAHGEAAHGEGGHGEGHGGHHGLTHSQIMNFIWHCLNFSILALVLVKYLKKPLSDGLKGRTESIRAQFADLDAKKAEAERKYAEYESKLSGMDQEAKQILENYIAQGQAEKERIIVQANEAAERIKAQAEFYVQQELAKAQTELRTEVAELAVGMAEDIIKKNLTDQDHDALISDYLERVVQKN
jgi:F-type H+-transporting ATPase subunit b